MTEPVVHRVETTDGNARLGVLTTPHGEVATPNFMPVGTRAAVRGLDSRDLVEVGTQMVLANTYHLMLRPGAETIAELGGLHSFMGWNGAMLTDSGGYQVFSLEPRVDENAATFRSTYDGASVKLTPEEAVRIQEYLGADIAMVLDVCIGLPAPRPEVEAAMDRTLRWAERALTAHERSDQALFGIVQGGTDDELRGRSAAATATLGFPGFGIGGLSVGESAEDRNRALDVVVAELPPGKPRYTMGLGDSEGVLDAVARGIDLFDCVWPTRLARHGRVLTPDGDFNLKRSEHRLSELPLQAGCPCLTCSMYTRAYLRHLLTTGELSVYRLISLHNLSYTMRLMQDVRSAVAAGRFAEFHAATISRRLSPTAE
ncbi:MAG: tRNA guanosine(34) transglycosylase Tgt [Acidimicrobiia bacterium]|nr:tRNA guanosine(34) transglycosylase Tgt [Acidimicrobiia bacterium]MDH3396331.1 tRNA guanosine(34) transglycosylase Tgt [Acidimicrobiia bacterium]